MKMKASVYEKYGPPSVLSLKEIERPVPKSKEILIKVHAATVNRSDCAMLTAKPFIMRGFTGLFGPKKPVLGTDFAGEVVEIGAEVQQFKVGDKVFGFDDQGVQSHAQFMAIREDKGMDVMPEKISFEEAAASIEGFHYAYNFVNKVDLKPGEKVMLNGATGAIGSAALQILKYYGARVTATCNTKNLELIKSLGADRVIDYLKEDFTQDQEQYEYVFDTVGKSTFAKCKPLLKDKGIYISSELGPLAQNLPLTIFTPLLSKFPGQSNNKIVRFPYPPNIKRSVLLVKKLIEENKFKPVIDRRYKLENIADAFTYVLSGQKTGNVVIVFE